MHVPIVAKYSYLHLWLTTNAQWTHNLKLLHKYLPYWKTSASGVWRERFKDALAAALASDCTLTDPPPKLRIHEANEEWWKVPPAPPANPDDNRFMQHNRFAAKISSKFNKKPLDTKETRRSQSIVTLMNYNANSAGALPRAVRAAKDILTQLHPAPPGLRFDWRDVIYTDGSVLG
jgi:hypothetical protein